MYGIALSVAACLRGGTRVDLAWSLDPALTPGFDATDAVGVTPGGGRLGSLLGGALDSRLVELSLAEPTEGRIVEVTLDEIEAGAIGLEPGATIRIFSAPAATLPDDLWERLLRREPVQIVARLDGDRVRSTRLGDEPASTAIEMTDTTLAVSWCPTPTLLILGGGPMAEALAAAGEFVGWRVEGFGGPDSAVGLAATLSPIDGVVVMGHDTEAVGRVIQAALGSDVGYIGSIGPARLQDDRRDWLAYRGITDTSRVHGPAGIPIRAQSPPEVALSVVVEMIAIQRGALP